MAYGAPLDGLPEIQKPAPLQLFRIRHGDVHDANVVFDVSSCADRVFRGSMGDAKQLKRVLMREIGRGPSQSSAKLVVVDFGIRESSQGGRVLRTRRRSLADGQDALGVAQVILVKSRGRFTGRGGWAYALVQRVDGEEDEFEFVSPVRLFIVRD